MKKRKTKVNILKKFVAGGVVFTAIVLAGKLGLLSDGPVEYTIPEGAISGGVYSENGISYERFQMNGKMFILNLSNGATIPQ